MGWSTNIKEWNIGTDWIIGIGIDINCNYKILLHYRFENINSPEVIMGTYSTYWIDGNDKTNNMVNSANYFYTENTLCGIAENKTNNFNTIFFNLLIPVIISKNNYSNYVVYIRVGLPQETDFSFETITAKIM